MLLRIFRIIARRVASCRVLVVMLLALQVLYLLPVLGSSYLDGWQEVERIEVDNVRSYASSDALDDQAYSVDNAVTAWLGEGGRKKAAAADRMIERYDAGDAHGYFEAAADYYRVTAEVQGYAGSQSLIDRAEAYQALADSGASDLYMVPDHMPASLYAVFGHKLLLALPGAQLPLIYTAQGDGMMTYNGQCELLFWMVPLVAVCGLGASLQTRGRLATQAPCTHRRRLLLGTLASASIPGRRLRPRSRRADAARWRRRSLVSRAVRLRARAGRLVGGGGPRAQHRAHGAGVACRLARDAPERLAF